MGFRGSARDAGMFSLFAGAAGAVSAIARSIARKTRLARYIASPSDDTAGRLVDARITASGNGDCGE